MLSENIKQGVERAPNRSLLYALGLTDEDISELARSKLNYAEPGERIFVDTSSR